VCEVFRIWRVHSIAEHRHILGDTAITSAAGIRLVVLVVSCEIIGDKTSLAVDANARIDRYSCSCESLPHQSQNRQLIRRFGMETWNGEELYSKSGKPS
jgi:hypothetical protein